MARDARTLRLRGEIELHRARAGLDGRGGTFEQPFTISIVDVNDPPTAPQLTNSSFAENQPPGTLVGLLSASDQDPLDTVSFSFVDGPDGEDNAAFAISGSRLETAAVLDSAVKSSYSVRVRASDGNGAAADVPLTITVVPDR